MLLTFSEAGEEGVGMDVYFAWTTLGAWLLGWLAWGLEWE